MRINIYCHLCNRSQDVIVKEVKTEGVYVQVTCECQGKTYRAYNPHTLIERIGLSLWQSLKAKHGEGEEEIP